MTMPRRVVFALAACAACVSAQAPTAPRIFARGVTNAFAQDPAPSTAAPGSLILIRGLNLGPPEGASSTGLPLAATLAGVSVTVNRRPASLVSVALDRIVAQVPWEIAPGMAEIVVTRASERSNPARIQIANVAPGIRTKDDKGYAEAVARKSGASITLTATGIGPTDPRLDNGAAAPEDLPALPRLPVRAYIGGLAVSAAVTFSTSKPGEFEIALEVPEAANPGDIINIFANNRAANRTTYGVERSVTSRWTKLASDTPELRAIGGSDLRGGFVVVNGARAADGCYPSYVIDASRETAKTIDACLTSPNRAAPSPFVEAVDGAAVAAFVGPPATDPASGVSSTVLILNPTGDPITVELPSPAMNLNSAGGNFVAVLAGTPPKPVEIDASTGAISDFQGTPGAGQAAGAALIPANLRVDLGEGLDEILSFVGTPDGIAVVVGDDSDQPKKAKLALVNNRGEVASAKDIPSGWVPLVAPRAPNQPPAGGAARGPVSRVAITFEPATRTVYVMVRSADSAKDALVAFGAGDPALIPFPDGWFAASCTPAVPVLQLELTQRFALLASNVAEKEFKQVCPASGFIVVDYAAQRVDAVPLPGQGQFNATAGFGDYNDFLFGSNTDPTRRGLSDTLFVLDGVTSSAFPPFSLPADVIGFTNLTPVPTTNQLVALATNRVAGDAGFVVFDFDTGATRRLYVPEGFQSVQLVDLFPATRKLVAKGIKPGNSGSEYVIYDLTSEESVTVHNPDGVAFVGNVPAVVPQPGQPQPAPQAAVQGQRPNRKANSIEAIGFSADRKQMGVLSVRVP